MFQSSVQGKLIKGDNKKVLDELILVGTQTTCAYIDPPYNNFDNFDHYDDKREFDVWLEEIIDVSKKIKKTLVNHGSLWVSIDDENMHYLKVALDGVFGKQNFVTTIIWQHRTSRENRAVFSNNHEYVLVYAIDKKAFKKYRNPLPYTDEWRKRFKNPDDDPRGPWQSVSATAQAGHATQSQHYELLSPLGFNHLPPKGRCWVLTRDRMTSAIDRGEVYFGKSGAGVPRIKKYLAEAVGGLTPHTLWTADEVGTTASAKKHMLQMLQEESVFETPKPEELLARIISISSNPGDLVLDAYLGSGTTASVAHKLGRRYIGIELGEHITTHCVERLRSVCSGESGGISQKIGWKGGGKFELSNSRAA